jgi:hypothetical protein
LCLFSSALASSERGAVRHGDQLVARRHDVADRDVVAGLEAQVAPGHDADDLAAVTDREAGHAELLREVDHLAHGVRGRDDDRIAQYAGLVALDAGHLGRLVARGQVLVHDADAALLRDGDRQAGLGDRVHGRRDQGQVQRDVAGEAGGEGGVLGRTWEYAGTNNTSSKVSALPSRRMSKLQMGNCTHRGRPGLSGTRAARYTAPMKRIGQCLVLGLCCLAWAVAQAQWQWVDKDGRKVFSDRAPPPDIPARNILRQPGSSARRHRGCCAGAAASAPGATARHRGRQ